MKTQVKRKMSAARKAAATNDRNFRTFLLVSQFEAEAIGARIARARDEAGLTQEQVADVATFSKRSLQDYEAGVRVPWKHMREIAAILDRRVEWFLHGESEQLDDERLSRLEAQVDETVDRLRRIERLLRGRGEEPPQDPPAEH